MILRLTAGDDGNDVSADNLIVDASGQPQPGGVQRHHDRPGRRDAHRGSGHHQVAGEFGSQADSITIDDLVQHTWLTTAGTFTLPG